MMLLLSHEDARVVVMVNNGVAIFAENKYQ